ncbi:MAG: hypothetical protein QM757_20010 [Paludibaculum sp.]
MSAAVKRSAQQVLARLHRPVHRTQPAQEPARVVVYDLRQPPLLRLVARVAEYQGLRERQRRLAEMQAVEEPPCTPARPRRLRVAKGRSG